MAPLGLELLVESFELLVGEGLDLGDLGVHLGDDLLGRDALALGDLEALADAVAQAAEPEDARVVGVGERLAGVAVLGVGLADAEEAGQGK